LYKFKLFNNATTRQYLSKFQLEILDESLNNDIFLIIDREFFSNNNIIKVGRLIVLDDKGNQYQQRQKSKVIKRLLDHIWGEVVCLPGRKGENIKTSTVSLGYGRTFYKKTKAGYVKTYRRYSVVTDVLLDKWPAK
jgi:hypothetical protein